MERRLEKQLRQIQRRIIGRNFSQLGSLFPPILMAGLVTLLQLNTVFTIIVLLGGWWLTSYIAGKITQRMMPPPDSVEQMIRQSSLVSRFAAGQTGEHSIIDYTPLLLRPLLEFELFNCGNPSGLAREASLVALNLDWYCREPAMIARPHWILQAMSLPFAVMIVSFSNMLYPMSEFAFTTMTVICTAGGYAFVSIPFAARQAMWTIVFFETLASGLDAKEDEGNDEEGEPEEEIELTRDRSAPAPYAENSPKDELTGGADETHP